MTTPPGRYHVSVVRDGARILNGWWDDADVAERKRAGYVREQPGAEVTLTEWDGGREWPLIPPASAGA